MTIDETIIVKLNSLESENDKKPYLTFIWGPRMGEIFSLDREETQVGRSPDCHLWIEDGAISRKHFVIKSVGDQNTLQDLGSTNGTLVNGEKVTEQVLQDGDKIQISKESILEYTLLDETRRLSEKKRYEMGVIDPVTNSFNKRYFLGRITEEFSFATRTKHGLSLIMFDIDFFKKLNDTFGHLAGDFVLQKIGMLVQKTVRTHDIFARYGGEEFVILMRETTCQNAVNLAERIRRIIESYEFIFENKKMPVAISCGIATITEEMKTYQDLIAEADKYLYQSKNGGRNRVAGPCKPQV